MSSASYRAEIRETVQRMSNEALAFQDRRVRGGIDREELDRELARRAGRWTVSNGRQPVVVMTDAEAALREAKYLAEAGPTVTVTEPSGKRWTL